MKKLTLTLLVFCVLNTAAQIPAFPGAEGAGMYATGGKYGDVYHVTNLNPSGAGSFKDAIKTAPLSGRTIVFDISGDIHLSANLTIDHPNLTIAGQTAPGNGICIRDYRVSLNANNLIIRHLRFRPEEVGGDGDALGIKGGKNIILDHCSISWSSDEVLSTSDNPIDSLSVQWCYIYEGRDISYHYENGILIDHSMGSLLSSSTDSAVISFHHNLYAHNRTRNPKITSGEADSTIFFDFQNNVIYDWGTKAGYSSDNSTHHIRMNYAGNYLIAGPSTKSSCKDEAFEGLSTSTWIYQQGNKIDADFNSTFNGTDTGWSMITNTYTPVNSIFEFSKYIPEPADSALIHVLNSGGAFFWKRDDADLRIIYDVFNNTGHVINNPDEVGGYTALKIENSSLTDTDGDGMPDYWEISKNLNPKNPKDTQLDRDNDGYTNLEEYLNNIPEKETTLNIKSIKLFNNSVSKVWPNPCKNLCNIEINSLNKILVDIGLLDNKGTYLFPAKQFILQQGNNQIQIDISGIEKGNYLLYIDKFSVVNKLIIK